MAKKLGDGAIGVMILIFLVTIGSLLFNSMDDAAGVSSGTVASNLGTLNQTASDTDGMVGSFVDSTDESSSLAVDDPDQQLEERGSDASGKANILNKNILTRFYTTVKTTIPEATFIMNFVIGLTALIFSVMLLRFILGEGKI